jgi:putative hydrolase of the HAD superfamily
MAAKAKLTAIGFDADDTLWRHGDFYLLAEQRLTGLLADFAAPEDVLQRLRRIELANLPLYGFGVKGFTLSMIETSIEAAGGRASAALIGEIVANGRELLRHPIELLPHVRETLATLADAFRLILITRGDLFDQERKLAQSGLVAFFDAVEIVSDKNASTYARVFARSADGPKYAMMVGNSMKSDVAPALEAGCWGVHVPHTVAWAVEHAEPPFDAARFKRLEHLGQLVDVIDELR